MLAGGLLAGLFPLSFVCVGNVLKLFWLLAPSWRVACSFFSSFFFSSSLALGSSEAGGLPVGRYLRPSLAYLTGGRL